MVVKTCVCVDSVNFSTSVDNFVCCVNFSGSENCVLRVLISSLMKICVNFFSCEGLC